MPTSFKSRWKLFLLCLIMNLPQPKTLRQESVINLYDFNFY
ncbi:hypothetical protein NIASO_16050 [Niabella soli DSM 19437]|uniref:Uncharacterized protein n=1 Tax=Niabella soli DSM 19437 TaxID=929713 RepID=W0F7U9_9BACT|nr:hypothetical protein NIASO_16050 [Niabella soli DSM 19437]